GQFNGDMPIHWGAEPRELDSREMVLWPKEEHCPDRLERIGGLACRCLSPGEGQHRANRSRVYSMVQFQYLLCWSWLAGSQQVEPGCVKIALIDDAAFWLRLTTGCQLKRRRFPFLPQDRH